MNIVIAAVLLREDFSLQRFRVCGLKVRGCASFGFRFGVLVYISMFHGSAPITARTGTQVTVTVIPF